MTHQSRPKLSSLAWALAASVLLTGCQPSFLAALGVKTPTDNNATSINGQPSNPTQVITGSTAGLKASIQGKISGPATLISNNAGGLISNNAGGLVSNNAGGYRTQAVASSAVAYAIVYLTNPNEQFYGGPDGKALYTYTDADGNYRFQLAPQNQPVVVTVLMPQNRRMVGFLTPAEGANRLDVDLATTLVTEFLRDQARLAHKTMADYSGLSAALPTLVSLTRSLLDRGDLKMEGDGAIDLAVNNIPALRNAYVKAFASSDQALSDTWQQLLGYRPLLIDELDVGMPSNVTITAVAAGNGKIYAAGINSLNLYVTETDAVTGHTRELFEADRNSGVNYVSGLTVQGSYLIVGGTDAGQLVIDPGQVTETEHEFQDADMNLSPGVMNWSWLGSDTTSWSAADVDAVNASTVIVASDVTNEIWRLHLDQLDEAGNAAGEIVAGIPFPMQGDADPLAHLDGSAPGASVALDFPTHVTVHREGSITYAYFADCLNQRIRRINLGDPDLTTETVLGRGHERYGNFIREDETASQSQLIDDPQGLPPDQVSLLFPHKLVFDSHDRMYFSDGDHRRVRVWDRGANRVFTLAGTVAGAPGVIGDSRRCGLGEVASIALDESGNLLVADARLPRLRRVRMPFGL